MLTGRKRPLDRADSATRAGLDSHSRGLSRPRALAYDGAMSDMLALSAALPEVAFAPGEIVIREGGSAGALWILVSGALKVTKCGVVVNSVTRPGALVGEISVLLDTVNGATVEATRAERPAPRRRRQGAAGQRPGDHPARRHRPGRTAQLRHHLPGRPEAAVRRRARPDDGLRRARPSRRPPGPGAQAGLGARPRARVLAPGVLRRASAPARARPPGSGFRCPSASATTRCRRRDRCRHGTAPGRSGGRR